MQLDAQKSIRAALTAITATLLGSSARAAPDWGTIDSSLLIYSETGRVKASEAVLDFLHKFNERRSLGLRLTLDALTGASPNGATPSSQIQTFTGPSGGTSYTVAPGEIPLDDTFSDQRGALDASLRESLDRITFLNIGGHLSIERDYTSLGLSGGLTRDLNRRNTTLGVSAAYAHDIVSPAGGAPVPLASMPPPTSGGEGEEEEEDEDEEGGGQGKDVIDVVVGLTQVLGRNTIARMDYSLSMSSGYLNDPYKILSVVQDRNSVAPGEPIDYVYESRPDARLKQAVFGELRRYVIGTAFDLSYRYFWDDWGITSHTIDVFDQVPLGRGHSIEPHFRWYRQSEANFYATYLVLGQPFPKYASADTRLAAFDAYTYGLQYAMPLGAGAHLSLSGEYYTQKGTRGPPEDFGVLSQYELFPALDVFMVRLGYTHDI
jgi:hypothetical protein